MQGFLGVDPLAGAFPGYSPYNYVLGNPISLVDPDGRMPSGDPPGGGGGAWEFVKGFAKGAFDAGFSALQGMAALQNPSTAGLALAPLFADPKGALIAVKDDLVATGAQITSGDPGQVGEGLGKATVFIAEMLIGGKGAGKIRGLVKGRALSVEKLVKSSTPGRKTKGRTKQYEREGGADQANRDFDALQPDNVKTINGGRTGTLSDGRQVTVRKQSTDGRPTVEIKKGKNKQKIRYDEKK